MSAEIPQEIQFKTDGGNMLVEYGRDYKSNVLIDKNTDKHKYAFQDPPAN